MPRLTSNGRLRGFFLSTLVAATALAAASEASAQGATKIYRSVPSATELNNDLFGRSEEAAPRTRSIRTRGLTAGTGTATAATPGFRAIRWREDQAAAAAPQLVEAPAEAEVFPAPTAVQTASLEGQAAAPTKLAFNIQFAFDSTRILPASQPFIDRLGEVMRAPDNAGKRLMIIGHTDASGPDNYNWRLSVARASAVRDYLVQNWGVSADTFTVEGRGEGELLASIDPFDATNRRVEFYSLD